MIKKEKILVLAESMGFSYRASGKDFQGSWVTFTYPGTNTYVAHVKYDKTDTIASITRFLADTLVTCGKIQLRQKLLKEFSPFYYGD